MKKLLSILLLIVGCDELTLNNNKISDGTAVTDTLYIFNYDTLIVTNNDEIFDVDWILLKNTAKQHYFCICNYYSDTIFVDTGYIFFSNNLSNIELLPPIPQEIAPMNTTELVSFDTTVLDLKFRYCPAPTNWTSLRVSIVS